MARKVTNKSSSYKQGARVTKYNVAQTKVGRKAVTETRKASPKTLGAEGPKKSTPRKPAMTASQRQKLTKKISRVASKFDRPAKRGR